MKLKLKNRRPLTQEELWAIEDEFPAVCGPSPLSYAARHGLTLSKRYLDYLHRQRQANGTSKKTKRAVASRSPRQRLAR